MRNGTSDASPKEAPFFTSPVGVARGAQGKLKMKNAPKKTTKSHLTRRLYNLSPASARHRPTPSRHLLRTQRPPACTPRSSGPSRGGSVPAAAVRPPPCRCWSHAPAAAALSPTPRVLGEGSKQLGWPFCPRLAASSCGGGVSRVLLPASVPPLKMARLRRRRRPQQQSAKPPLNPANEPLRGQHHGLDRVVVLVEQGPCRHISSAI